MYFVEQTHSDLGGRVTSLKDLSQQKCVSSATLDLQMLVDTDFLLSRKDCGLSAPQQSLPYTRVPGELVLSESRSSALRPKWGERGG